MVGKTAAERKAEERARKRSSGFQKYELWLTPVEWGFVRSYLGRLRKRLAKHGPVAESLRRVNKHVAKQPTESRE